MVYVPPVPPALTVTVLSLVAQLLRLSGSAESRWGLFSTDHMSSGTQALGFSKDKNKVGSYKLKISAKVI